MTAKAISRRGGFPAADLEQPRLANRRSLMLAGIMAGAIGLVLLVVTNLPWQLDDYDQAKQAFTSFEMIKEGHWFYQHTPHERVATKPPLIGWISAGLFVITRSWDLAWRLPSFLGAAALSVLLFRLASSAYGSAAGLIASSAFVFNLLTPRLATLVRTDMPLALVIFLVGALLWQRIRQPEPERGRDRFLVFVLLTAAMLIKGPIVYAFLLPGIIVFEICGGSRSASAMFQPGEDGCRQHVHFGWWPWIASLGIFLIWVGGGVFSEPDFFEQVVVREFLGRFGTTVHQSKQLFFYLPHLLHKFLPWSVLMIGIAVARLIAQRRAFGVAAPLTRGEEEGEGSRLQPSFNRSASKPARASSPGLEYLRVAAANISPETWWLICWSFGGLIVMSLIPSKRVDRIFPVIPPLCLLLAAQIGSKSMACGHGSAAARSVTDQPRAPGQSEPTTAQDAGSGCSHGSASGLPETFSVQTTGHRPLPARHHAGRGRFLRWSFVALIIAVLLTTAYAAVKIVSGYRIHRDALVRFGRDVRDQAGAHRWRYEVLKSPDEGLLLYLDRTHFIAPERAIAEWNSGNLDALIAPARDAGLLMGKLHDAVLTGLRSDERGENAMDYVLIIH